MVSRIVLKHKTVGFERLVSLSPTGVKTFAYLKTVRPVAEMSAGQPEAFGHSLLFQNEGRLFAGGGGITSVLLRLATVWVVGSRVETIISLQSNLSMI